MPYVHLMHWRLNPTFSFHFTCMKIFCNPVLCLSRVIICMLFSVHFYITWLEKSVHAILQGAALLSAPTPLSNTYIWVKVTLKCIAILDLAYFNCFMQDLYLHMILLAFTIILDLTFYTVYSCLCPYKCDLGSYRPWSCMWHVILCAEQLYTVLSKSSKPWQSYMYHVCSNFGQIIKKIILSRSTQISFI